MAISDELPSLDVKIVCNNAPLAEYDDDGDADDDEVQPKTVSKYIEATSGAEFEVQCTFARPYPEFDVLVTVYLDGKFVVSSYAERHHFHGKKYTLFQKGKRYNKGNLGYVQKFCFSQLTIDDSGKTHSNDKNKSDLDRVGQISVKAYYVRNLREVTKSRNDAPARVEALGPISEKSLKGKTLSHQAILATPQPHTTVTFLECDDVDDKKLPFATYNFNYRSRTALQSLLIIPRSPTPIPLEERNVDDLTPDEMRELLRRQREREEASRAVKTERVKTERVKRERDESGNIGEYADEVSFVSVKRRRGPPVIINDDGVEVLDLT